VMAISVVWFCLSLLSRPISVWPTAVGLSVHGILLTAPFLSIAAHGAHVPDWATILGHAIAASFYFALLVHHPRDRRA
jgi:hypothetical protein